MVLQQGLIAPVKPSGGSNLRRVRVSGVHRNGRGETSVVDFRRILITSRKKAQAAKDILDEYVASGGFLRKHERLFAAQNFSELG